MYGQKILIRGYIALLNNIMEKKIKIPIPAITILLALRISLLIETADKIATAEFANNAINGTYS